MLGVFMLKGIFASVVTDNCNTMLDYKGNVDHISFSALVGGDGQVYAPATLPPVLIG
jgi:hypothetical protein